jgi:hypothetical protein
VFVCLEVRTSAATAPLYFLFLSSFLTELCYHSCCCSDPEQMRKKVKAWAEFLSSLLVIPFTKLNSMELEDLTSEYSERERRVQLSGVTTTSASFVR